MRDSYYGYESLVDHFCATAERLDMITTALPTFEYHKKFARGNAHFVGSLMPEEISSCSFYGSVPSYLISSRFQPLSEVKAQRKYKQEEDARAERARQNDGTAQSSENAPKKPNYGARGKMAEQEGASRGSSSSGFWFFNSMIMCDSDVRKDRDHNGCR